MLAKSLGHGNLQPWPSPSSASWRASQSIMGSPAHLLTEPCCTQALGNYVPAMQVRDHIGRNAAVCSLPVPSLPQNSPTLPPIWIKISLPGHRNTQCPERTGTGNQWISLNYSTAKVNRLQAPLAVHWTGRGWHRLPGSFSCGFSSSWHISTSCLEDSVTLSPQDVRANETYRLVVNKTASLPPV